MEVDDSIGRDSFAERCRRSGYGVRKISVVGGERELSKRDEEDEVRMARDIYRWECTGDSCPFIFDFYFF